MATDQTTYGFEKQDALALLRHVGGGDDTYQEGRTRGGGNVAMYLFTLTGTISSGAGTATIRNLPDTTEIATGISLKDPLGHFDGLTSGYRGFCVKQGGIYYAIGPYVVNVRWDDPDLEQTRDGSTYTNIDTAEDCS
jgi:hypothetical protein